jgi:hypothetical protein
MAEKTTWSGAALTESDINLYLNHTGSAWNAYTPTWTAFTTNPTIGNGTLDGAYWKAGRGCAFRIRVIPGTTTTFGTGTYFLSAPFATSAATPPQVVSMLVWRTAGTGAAHNFTGYLPTSSSTIQFPIGDGSVNQWAPTSPFTLANTDIVIVSGFYETAT